MIEIRSAESRCEAPGIEVHSTKSKHKAPRLKVHSVKLFSLNWQVLVPDLGTRQLVTIYDWNSLSQLCKEKKVLHTDSVDRYRALVAKTR